jgi:TolA-binding protein
MRYFPLRPIALAAALMAASAMASAADVSQAKLLKELKRLSARLEKIEQRNAELEKRLASPAQAGNVEQRLKSLEESRASLEKGMENENISENEPEITSRLKAVEYQALGMQKQARTVEALEGITAGMSLTTTAQKASGTAPGAAPNGASQLNYRGDVYVTLPLPDIGNIENRIFAQFRIGQGKGLNDLPVYAKPNASAFRALNTDPDNSVAILGQAWYQASIPLPFGGFKPRSRESLEINFGKMDPFVFFDQNTVANDETRQFLNTVFVHNALLDAGGDIGVDANGFSPGFRLSYLNQEAKPESWRASLGVFGSGRGANYERFFSSPLVIAQLETQRKFLGGLDGNYRIYAWRNGQGPAYDGTFESHAGWGLSFDQRVGDYTTLFGRLGQQTTGHVRFDRALSFGAELGGSYWERGGDAIGLAFGLQHTSADFNRDSATVDADGDGVPDYGYTASGSEKVLEAYYRYRIHKQFELSPDFQYISNPGGHGASSALKILGLRAQLTF